MKAWTLIMITAAGVFFAWAAAAVPGGGLPTQVCDGPAGASNPHCESLDPASPADDAAVPEPGAAAAFAVGAALVAARTRRR